VSVARAGYGVVAGRGPVTANAVGSLHLCVSARGHPTSETVTPALGHLYKCMSTPTNEHIPCRLSMDGAVVSACPKPVSVQQKHCFCFSRGQITACVQQLLDVNTRDTYKRKACVRVLRTCSPVHEHACILGSMEACQRGVI